jgi:hypothetical protein
MSQAQKPASKGEWLRRAWRENRGTLIVLGAILVAFLALRSSPSEIASVEALQAELPAGPPTVLYFYSNT